MSTVCIILCLFYAQINKNNISNLIINSELRASQLLQAVALKANAEGQMQGRDWAIQQNTIAAATVITDAANVAAQLLTSAANTANKLAE